MLTNMSIIANGPVTAVPVTPTKPPTTPDAGQFAPPKTLSSPSTNHSETTTTDNISAEGENQPIKTQKFSQTFQEEIMTQQPQQPPSNTNSKGQNTPDGAAEQPNIVLQSGLQQYSLTAECNEEPVAVKAEPKADIQLAQMPAGLEAGKTASVTTQAAKPTTKKLPQLLPATSQPGNKPLQSAADQSQITPKALSLNTSQSTFTAAIQPGSGENTAEIQISNQTPLTTIPPSSGTNQQRGQQLVPGAAVDTGSRTTLVGNETATAGSEAILVLNKTAVDAENTTVTDKPPVSDAPKTPVLNNNLPVAEAEPSDARQKVPVGPGKSALIAEKPTDNKPDTAQQTNPGSELSNDNGKNQGENPPADYLIKDFNPAQLQISANQTKNRSSSTANNSSNSNFEQILTPNNAQPPLAEQSSASAQAVKTPANASPTNLFTSLNEQIQESITTSLRQGDQQITISLNPPELGRVFIKFQEHSGQIIGLLEVDKTQTRYEIEHLLPQLVQNLQDSGIQVKRLEVVLTEQSNQQLYKDQSLQDSSFQQYDSTNPGAPGDKNNANQWLANDYTYVGATEQQELFVTDKSINMLV